MGSALDSRVKLSILLTEQAHFAQQKQFVNLTKFF